ncbi:polyprenyl synthetase family protein [Oceanicella actignis]|uniref:polyprenyl synthetase family protein n=1 Tax=Oceanicella actignis TaxID=1189325 RepID=UPI0011E64008|nr:farnesyl diphosphate synthase [Oceanicella actignis]TYO89152.1 farnesyl diphosphate synthase [Oceanicella actignis]
MNGAPASAAPRAADADFARRLGAAAAEVEAALDALLPAAAEGPVAEAMRWAALGGGKRLRAFLALESAALCGAPRQDALRAAAAVECVHAYSLVHDDLPCMDDDDMRRGRPTVHVKWDEATAVLAGDALQALAFEILAAPETGPAEARAALCAALAQAAGARGMVGGQALDIAAQTAPAPLGLEEITRLQALKTGALIRFAAVSGALLAGDADAARALAAYADALGLAFQIRDDILDVEGDAAQMGKRVGKDDAAGKATFVSLLGLDGARRAAEERARAAEAALAPFGAAAAPLAGAARFAVERRS